MKKWYFTARVNLLHNNGAGPQKKLLVSGVKEGDGDVFPLEHISDYIKMLCNRSLETQVHQGTEIHFHILNQVIVRSDLTAAPFEKCTIIA